MFKMGLKYTHNHNEFDVCISLLRLLLILSLKKSVTFLTSSKDTYVLHVTFHLYGESERNFSYDLIRLIIKIYFAIIS